MMRDLCTSIYCAEPQTLRRMLENIGHGVEPSRTAGATSGRNRGAAAEADTIEE